jgi:hypothetical protein
MAASRADARWGRGGAGERDMRSMKGKGWGIVYVTVYEVNTLAASVTSFS